MVNLLKSFIKEEEGLGTVEIVVIIAVLVGLAFIFRTYIFAFVQGILNKVLNDTESVIAKPEVTPSVNYVASPTPR